MIALSTSRKLQFFQELIQSSNVAILVADRARNNIFVNQKTCELFGYSEGELVGQPTSIFHISKESAEKFANLVLDAVLKKGGGEVGVDYQWKRKDGTTFWGHISGSLTKDSEEVLWTLFDIDERMETEEMQLKNRHQAQIIEQIHEAVVVFDLDGIVTSWNNGAKALLGYSADEMLGRSISILYPSEDLHILEQALKELRIDGYTKEERVFLHKDGSRVDVLLSSSLFRNDEGNVTHVIGYAQDITLIKRAQKNILQADMFYALVENSFVAIYVIQNGEIVYTNKKFRDVFGYSEEDMNHLNSDNLVHPDDLNLVIGNLKEREKNLGLGIEYNFRGVKKSGEILDLHVYGSSVMLYDGSQAIIGILTDETEKNRDKQKLEILANKDTLTELYNRNHFNNELKRMVSVADREKHLMALILFDIDNFKRVNDSLGHLAGDYIIQETAKRVLGILRGGDSFYRIGGDEFTIIIENYEKKEHILALLSRITEAMSQSIEIENIAFHISLSIGIALYPHDAQDEVTLQKRADLAMYEAKSNGKNTYVFYHGNDVETEIKVTLEDELFRAYDENQFELFLQPQVASGDAGLLGSEALIRWKHPSRGIINPECFLPLAEEIGLLYKLDLFMLESALKLLYQHKKKGLKIFRISVNVSNALFMHQKFLESVEQLASNYKQEILLIELELTENITMKNETYSKTIIDRLKFLGFRISIDDFGTGYSSLSHLKLLEINELKIDKSFIDDIVINQTDRSIVKAIIEMCKALSLKSVAEGVEDEKQLKILKDMGCDMIQGYYFSKPLSSGEFEKRWLV
jgi:diguanylate cyclase (GGDEF)-like protein/PAS domain S-box-containing protein